MGQDKPKRADAVLVLTEYQRYHKAAKRFACQLRDFTGDEGDEALDAIIQADKKALKPVQMAWINATSYVNSADKWPLVTEQMIVDLLLDFKLWPRERGRRTVSEIAWEEAHSDDPDYAEAYAQVAEWNRPKRKTTQ